MSDDPTPTSAGPFGESREGLALAAVADKWAILAVHALRDGAARHGELMRQTGCASHPSLTRALRGLETAGLVTRTAYPEVPPRVEYALTERGRGLAEHIGALASWARDNSDALIPPPADRRVSATPRAPARSPGRRS